MKKLCFLFVCVFVLACTKEKTTISPVESSKSDRLVFKDANEFFETSTALSKITSFTDLQFWAQEKDHSTLLDDTTLSNYSPSLRTILNKDSEFQIGDSIIWFHSGNLYSFTKNAPFVKDLKANPDLYKRSGHISSTVVVPSVKKILVYPNSYGGCLQKEFKQWYYQPCGGTLQWSGGGNRKWVTEARDQTFTYNGLEHSMLYLVIKLEWKVSSWKEASEQRDVTWNLSGTIYFYNAGVNTPIDLQATSGSHLCSTGNPQSLNWWTPLGVINDYVQDGGRGWNTRLDGSVYQHILGNSDRNSLEILDPYTETISWHSF